jgi:tetratricopeptide (TPR) repeat protein
MPDRALRDALEASQLGDEASRLLKMAVPQLAREKAKLAIEKALGTRTRSGFEIAAEAAQVMAFGYAFDDRLDAALLAAAQAQTLAREGHLPGAFKAQTELTYLQILEMRRDLVSAMDRLAITGQELADSEPRLALRAWSRRTACAVWKADRLQAERSIREGSRVLAAKQQDADSIGSFWIWQAQADMRRGRFEEADDRLHEALDLREQTPRRAITDVFAAAYLELAQGHVDEGRELVAVFAEETSAANLRHYQRIALDQLAPLLG